MAAFCSITDALAEAQFEVLKRINNKFDALRRLAELLEQLGDLSVLIPNLSQLIPILDIDLDAYVNLRANCPFLNLPPVNEASLDGLRNQVLSAYSQLTSRVLNHPWMRMGKLQDQLSRYQAQFNTAFAEGSQYIQCLQAACQTAEALADTGESFAKRVVNTDIGNELARFSRNYVDQAGQVLTNAGKAKYEQAARVVDRMKELGADVGNDYKTAKQAATTGTGQPTPPKALAENPSRSLTPNEPVVNIPNATPIILPPP